MTLTETAVVKEASHNPGWRDDLKFLFELCKAFQFYQVTLVIYFCEKLFYYLKFSYFLEKW